MIIDQTRYSAFLKNPELFRLRYMLDLDQRKGQENAPNQHGRRRGTAFHIMAEESHKGANEQAITAKVTAKIPHDTEAIQEAERMFSAYKKATNPKYTKVAAELAFSHRIEGSPHYMTGRIDGIVTGRDGLIWVDETKTAGRRADLAKLKWEWSHNPQADFEIIGALACGYKVEGVLVHTIVEATPYPKVWPITVKRTESQLAVIQYNVHQVCEMIRMLQDTFGVEKPWPHVPATYNGCTQPGRCDFDGDCGCVLAPETTVQYNKREEHLEGIGQWRST